MDWTQRIGRRLKPRDLSIFMVVVEKQNMALAADHLAISRPVVSKTISDLERTLGVQLFDRFPHGVEPTLYGRALFKRSSAIFDELRQSVEELDFLADPRTGELRIATTEALSAGLIAATIDRLVRRFPRWTFQSVVSGVGTRTELLRSRQVELVVARQYAHDASISAETLFFDRLLVVAGPTSIWARQRKITLADLVEAPWIQARHEIEPGAPTYEAFRRLGLEVPEVKILSDSIDLRYGLLAKGDFVTMIPESVLRFAPARKLLKVLPLDIPRWTHPTAITTLKNRTLSNPARLFIECIRELAKPLGEEKRHTDDTPRSKARSG